ncbi:MAG: peptide ABC transporter ATP-binding protein, partial [Oculatellaceae cyanobacterium Prado106]|nr:peptide ABC transporter ATP-binding protein [Oculatellaceae cyanobacterium Prado106]
VLSVMQQLANEGMTMIIATHEMDFAQDVADRVVFLDGGQIVETSDPKTFFSRPSTGRARQFLERYHRAS